MDDSDLMETCSLCGREGAAEHGHAEEGSRGVRVELTVAEVRGILALCHPVGKPEEIQKEIATDLATALGLAVSDLPGCCYTCLITPGEYGFFRSDYVLVRPN
ncbi:hypothetical protein ACN20G_18850 [Streptomyces sp. BI20]|uniref:hypothetical protein n=1 Tax=Streptomyces sp. BI20 TaxID=3403460 RepID=UPI003C71658F